MTKHSKPLEVNLTQAKSARAEPFALRTPAWYLFDCRCRASKTKYHLDCSIYAGTLKFLQLSVAYGLDPLSAEIPCLELTLAETVPDHFIRPHDLEELELSPGLHLSQHL